MKFLLQIALDNAGMETTADVVEALRKTACYIRAGSIDQPMIESRPIQDENGNTVGFWEFKED